MEQLEQSANILMSPPNLVTAEQRQEAGNVFIQFRNTINPYDMCKEILESSKSEFVLFEVANLLSVSVTKEWGEIFKGPAIELKNYLLQYLCAKPLLYYSVKGYLLKTIVFISLHEDTPDMESRLLWSDTIYLLNADDENKCILGCGMARAMIQEYINMGSTTVHESDSSLDGEIKQKSFESFQLLPIYLAVVKLLARVRGDTPITNDMMPLMKNLVSLAEDIFSWPFCKFDVFAMQNGIFSPEKCWKESVISTEIIDLFFNLYSKCKGNPQLGHHLLACLVQLSALKGECVAKNEDKVAYTQIMILCVHAYITNHEILDSDALGIATIVMKICLCNFDCNPNCYLEREIPVEFQCFALDIFNLTVLYIDKAAQERGNDPEDQLYNDGLDKLLVGIEAISSRCTNETCDFMRPYHGRIFHKFLFSHLSVPDGTKQMIEDDEDVGEESEPDYIKYSIQIALIMQLGMKDSQSSLTQISQMLEMRCEQLRIVLSSDTPTPGMNQLFDDIYWLLMMAGQVMACPFCRDGLMLDNQEWINGHQEDLHINTSIIIGGMDTPLDQLGIGDPTALNPYIRLLAAVFRIWKLDIFATANRRPILLSPEVCSSLIWFMRYFFQGAYDDSEHDSVFGALFTDQIHAYMMNTAISGIYVGLKHRSSEPALVENYSRLLKILPETYKKSKIRITELSHFPELIRLSTSGELAHTSPNAQIVLLEGLVRCGIVYPRGQQQRSYWQPILEGHVNNFRSIVQNPDFARNSGDELIRRRVIFHLDNLNAICGAVCSRISNHLYDLAIDEGLKLALICMGVYHNYKDVVESALKAFLSASKVIMSIEEAHEKFVHHVMELRNIYVKCNIGKRTYRANCDEEDKLADLLLLLKISNTILSIELEDEKYTIYGMCMITDLMNLDVMQDPDICLQYFTLVNNSSIFAIRTEHYICQEMQPTLKNILTWVELGLSSYGNEIAVICLSTLSGAIDLIVSDANERNTSHFRPFLQVILKLLFDHQLSYDTLEMSAFAMLTLIKWYKDDFDRFMSIIISHQTSPALQARLTDACGQLSERSIQLTKFTSIHKYNGIIYGEAVEAYLKFIKLGHMCGARTKFANVPDTFSMAKLSNALVS